ncbi:hypothetical protein N7491_008153 [Penicillium cf. griseofulvum]|uniref:Uncharacterized protein n=1 Tax=Penicillium cf. griseofulvum TaxID=2972120 RepID=A0A9W9M5N5_9EURO|nr:hypothetical protein N7472_008817 [Penicillium cf. griseofulvum]KAJ5427711.1 hypothetical protein N7491_008153 [Penicillium cf. griseofulvum]KAJ5431911.1 hypothetical protein N7445_008409 [Penicillium cf. griseofulvum]
MQFTKALLFLSALAPVAFATEAASAECITKTITLVPSGYTPPSSTPTPISTTETPSSTWTPVITSTPSSSATPSVSHIASSSTRLIKSTSTHAGETASPTPSLPATNAASVHLPGFMAAGAAAIAGLLMI